MIPSYDDLTPSIPDVVSSETVAQLALFLGTGPQAQRATDPPGAPLVSTASLFACLCRRQPSSDQALERSPDGLLAVARDFSPRVMRVATPDRLDIVLDVSGLGQLIGEPPAIARELARALGEASIDALVAIASTHTAARLLVSGGAAGVAVAPGDPAAAVASLPVADLEPLETLPPAINVRDRIRPYETFERWGIHTLGDLAALPADALSSRLGRRGVALQRLARGLDPRPFVPDADSPRYLERLDLEWPIEALEPLSFILARLLDPLSAALERADRGAAAIRLDLRLTDRSTHARVLQLPTAMRDPRVLRTLLLLDLESHPPHAAIDIVTVEVDPAPARITQFSLLERALPSPETLSTLIARLSALAGETRCGAAVLLDTHQPGAFAMTRFEVDQRTPRAQAASEGHDRMLLRRQRIPPAIRVNVEHGRPAHVAAARRGMPCGAVVQAAGPWRTSGGWWTSESEPVTGTVQDIGHRHAPWDRDEWDVALAGGAVCRIFQDRATARWFLDGVYD
jgi:protein ImuB